MNKIIMLCLCFFLTQYSYGQESETFNRKGKVLIETGYNFFSFFSGGSGLGIISADGETVSSIGFEGGYFTNQNFVLKFGFNTISAGGSSITSFQAGGKYYIAGVAPIELTGGLVSGGGGSSFLGNFSIGYGIKLARNINLEPTIGIIATDDSADNLNVGINFAMFL